jgi:hypothetical protein
MTPVVTPAIPAPSPSLLALAGPLRAAHERYRAAVGRRDSAASELKSANNELARIAREAKAPPPAGIASSERIAQQEGAIAKATKRQVKASAEVQAAHDDVETAAAEIFRLHDPYARALADELGPVRAGLVAEFEKTMAETMSLLVLVTDVNRVLQTGRLEVDARVMHPLAEHNVAGHLASQVDRTPVAPWQPYHALAYSIRRVDAPLHRQAAE